MKKKKQENTEENIIRVKCLCTTVWHLRIVKNFIKKKRKKGRG